VAYMTNRTRASIFLATALILPAALAQQKFDDAYGAKIREFTTLPQFSTELVDHLPASDTVPTPEKFLGYIVGTPDKLTYAADVHRYLRELERSSPRVKVFSIGQTEEGREMVLAVISDESNLRRLDRLKDITTRLSDPRKTSAAESETLIQEGLPFYWATGSIHSPETGSPEMLMEMAYRLAVEDSPLIQNIRKNAVVMITPVVEVDGRERQVDLYRYKKANPDLPAPSLIYWGKYVAHDNNRDGMGLSLALSRNITKAFLEFHPQVLHDLHESVPYLYTSTGMGPYNAWLDPIVIDEWQKLAWHEVEQMTRRGVPGVWTWGFYDGWGANYLMEVAHGHNSIGRFYETFGNGGADTRERTLTSSSTTRAWYRPNPPLSRVKWSLRNNVNLQQSALLLAMDYAATNGKTFLRNYYLKSARAVAKPANEGPAAYLISTDERPHEAANLVNLLRRHGVEVHRLERFAEGYSAGAYCVRMDQPYSRLADMLLDRQYYSTSDPSPYDDTGWTLPALRNLSYKRVTDVALLQQPMTLLTADEAPASRVEGTGTVFLLNTNADAALATLRYRLKDVRIQAAEASFDAAGKRFAAGSWVIASQNNAADLRVSLEKAAAGLGVVFTAVADTPNVALHELAAPRIALVHTWTSTQNEGWFRLAFESLAVPYTYVSDTVLRETPNLRDKFDVIVFGPTSGTPQRILTGLPMRGAPIAWKASPLTPSFGTSPDQSDDIRGGLGLEGLINVRKFVESGGLFVTVGGNASLLINTGLVGGVSINTAKNLQVRGSVIDSVVADAKSPIVYGYGEHLPVYFNQGPIFDVSLTGFRADAPEPKPSGRGAASDPDVVQGRPLPTGPVPGPEAEEEEMMEYMKNLLPPPDQRPRVVLSFAPESELLISGMLAGGKELAGKPALVDVPSGKGHYLLFANNPMWRQQTQGSFSLIFNAAFNYQSLNEGRAAKAK
jgi:hypothetical protein